MKRMIKALSLLLGLVFLAGCASGWREPEHEPSDNMDIPQVTTSDSEEQNGSFDIPMQFWYNGVIYRYANRWETELPSGFTLAGTVQSMSYGEFQEKQAANTLENLDGIMPEVDVYLSSDTPGTAWVYAGDSREFYAPTGKLWARFAASDWRAPDQVTLEDIDVTVRLSHAAIHPDSVNIGVYFENHTDRELEHGIGFTVERLESDGSWKQLRFTFDAFVWIIEPIPAGETAELVYSMTDFRQPLTEGRYRITPEDLTASAGKQVPVNSYPIPPLEFAVRTDSENVALTDPLAAKYAAPEEPPDPEPALVPAEELLAQYPDSYQELRDRPALVLDVHGQLVNGKLWEDFYNSVRNEIPSQVVIARLTIEGDPILYLICYDGETFHWYMDASRDTYGAEPLQSGNATHMLLLEHNGYLWYELSNEPFETWEEYQSWTEDPQNEGKPWPVNILTLPLQG